MFCFSSSRLDAQFTKQDIVFLRKNSEQVKAEFGQIRLEQMRFAGLVDHAFVPHRRENCEWHHTAPFGKPATCIDLTPAQEGAP